MIECAVCDASPLIFFVESGHLNLLKDAAGQIVIPTAVADEIQARGSKDPTASALAAESWLQIKPDPSIPVIVSAWGLGRGESAVIGHAINSKGAWAFMDDLAGRRCATFVDVHVRGTLGIVLQAKRKERIKSARTVMEDMMAVGLYLSSTILDQALALVDE